jgi:hypothetical protein
MNLNSVDYGVNVTVWLTDLYKVTEIGGVVMYLGNGSIVATVITNPCWL